MAQRLGLRLLCVLLALALLSCGEGSPKAKWKPTRSYGPVEFADDAEANTQVAPGVLELAFRDSEGKQIDLRQYRGQKHVILVVTRGYPGYVCPYCSAQTSRLIENYEKFAKLNAEVLVVFPGPSTKLPEFVAKSLPTAETNKIPFPLLLDEGFGAIEKLGIRGDLAKPSTYIVDKDGKIRFAYVGKSDSNRPSVKVLFRELEKIDKPPPDKADGGGAGAKQ